MRADYLAEFEAMVNQEWKHLGEKVTASGARCIGHVPHIGWAAWLHRFYAGCDSEELDAAERRMSRRIPLDWRKVLGACNGLHLFIATVWLDGVLAGGLLQRSIEDPQPFSIEDANGVHRPRSPILRGDDLIIGGATFDVDSIYVLRADDSIVKLMRDGSEVLAGWDSAEKMLYEEYSAARSAYDQEERTSS